MKRGFLFILVFFFLISCKKPSPSVSEKWTEISENLKFRDTPAALSVQSGKFKYEINREKIPFGRVILLNASLVGYFIELQLEDKIVGISSPEYIFSEKIQKRLADGSIQNVGSEQKYDLEKIIALKPDFIFTNYIPTFDNAYKFLKDRGITVLFLDEYLEQDPLKKMQYLLLFGALSGKREIASERAAFIRKQYDSVKILANGAAHRPLVLANEMYGSQWYLPGGQSQLANFLADAGAVYINAENKDKGAVAKSFEEVFVKSQKAEFWVNVGNHERKSELLQINPNYARMTVYQRGKLYSVSGRTHGKTNDYFESGVVRADLVLKDYVRIFHSELLPGHKLIYMKPLQ